MKNQIWKTLFTWGVIILKSCTLISAQLKNYPESVLKLAQMESVEEVISYYGYPVETHHTQTEDGYILELNRLTNQGGPPIFLMHGLEASSMNFVMMGPWSDLAYLLHDRGYDVWLGNARGSRYSRQHRTLNPDEDEEFWNFSWHEIGTRDLPAMIDFVLEKTQFEKLTYVGHSQGCAAFFVMSSVKPEYNQKIHLMHALTPGVYLSHIKTPMISMAKIFFQTYKFPFKMEFNPQSPTYRSMCLGSQLMLKQCLGIYAQLVGDNNENLNKTMIPVLLYHFPAGAGVRQLAHYYQVLKTGIFGAFEEGWWLDNTTTHKGYPLDNVSAPVALYYCQNDNFVAVEDAQQLAKELPNLVENILMPMEKWNHMDPLIGMDARTNLYNLMLNIQKKYV